MMRASEPGQASDGYRGTDGLAVGPACALLAVLLYASFTLVSRLGLRSALGVADLAAIRFGTGGLLLSPVLLCHGLQPGHTAALALAILGGLGFALLCYVGFSLAPASHGGVLVHGCLPHFTFAILWSTRTARCAPPPHDRRCDADCGRRSHHDGRHAGAGIAEAGRHRAVRGRCPGLTGLVAVPLMGEIPGLLAIAGVIQTTLGMLVGLTGATGTPRHAVRNRFPSAFAGKTGRSRD